MSPSRHRTALKVVAPCSSRSFQALPAGVDTDADRGDPCGRLLSGKRPRHSNARIGALGGSTTERAGSASAPMPRASMRIALYPTHVGFKRDGRGRANGRPEGTPTRREGWRHDH